MAGKKVSIDDLYLTKYSQFIPLAWKSVPVTMENAALGYPIRKQKAVSFFNLLNNFNLSLTLWTTFFFSFLGVLVVSFLLNKLAHRIHFETTTARRAPKLSKQFASTVRSFGLKKVSAISIFVLFVYEFIWVTQIFLINNIKVEV